MDTQCQYPSRRCYNTRSVKISGELHRFCIFHRRRANAAQRRWTLKRQREGETSVSDTSDCQQAAPPKRRRSQQDSKPATKSNSKPHSKTAVYSSASVAPSSPVVKWEDSLDLQMSDEDVVILRSILLDADDDDARWDQRAYDPILAIPWWEVTFHCHSTTGCSSSIV